MNAMLWPGILNASNSERNAQHRRFALLSLLIVSFCVVFSQKTFITLDPTARIAAYALAPLVPITIGSLLIGTRAGTALGIFSGVMLYLHSIIMPLDFQELTIISLSLAVALFTMYSLIIGFLFSQTLPKASGVKQGIAYILSDCFITSLLVGIFIKLFTQITPSLTDVVALIIANFIVPGIFAVVIYLVVRHLEKVADDIGVREAFNTLLLIFVSLVFIVGATLSYVSVTIGEMENAEAAIKSEVNYLCLQLDSRSERIETFERLLDTNGIPEEALTENSSQDYEFLSDPVGNILDGYTMEQTGTVLIAIDDHVVATDDRRILPGSKTSDLGLATVDAIRASLETSEIQHIVYDGVLTDAGDTGGHAHNKQVGYLLAGQVDDLTVVIIEPSSMVFRNRRDVMVHEMTMTFVVLIAAFLLGTNLLSTTVAKRIDQTNEALARITSGDLNSRVEVAGTKEFKSLSAGINATVDALNELLEESARSMERDLKTARAIQEGALPKQIPAFADVGCIDLFASMDAAKVVGGDFYDYFKIDDRTVAFLIADVSGKGIPGALFMMVAKAEIQNYLSTGMDIAEAIRLSNEYLCSHNEAGMFVTVWAATLDWPTGTLTYVNAGHNFPLLRHGHNGDWEWLNKKGGLFLGTFDSAKYRKESLVLEAGDELILYTDGVNEAFNVEGVEYGNDRLEAFLAAHSDERPRDLAKKLRADIANWAEGAEQSDDITIVVLEYDVGEDKVISEQKESSVSS